MLEDNIKDLQAIVNREQVDEELSDDELAGMAGGGSAPFQQTTRMPILPTRPRR